MSWCKICEREICSEYCPTCGSKAESDIPIEIFWCSDCNVPIIYRTNDISKEICPLCGSESKYISTDLRPVFPEERLLLEIILEKPLEFLKKSVWASDNRYIIDGEIISITKKYYNKFTPQQINHQLNILRKLNSYSFFERTIEKFVKANNERLNFLVDEAFVFIRSVAAQFPEERVVISFSGGKDSTVTADLVTRAFGNPSLVHIFGNTTLEFPLTIQYVTRFRNDNPFAIFKTAINNDQRFMDVCEDIGPPSRMMRWCCSMFKTGPITRVINALYGAEQILTFYGIRKAESVSRSKYNRVEDSSESMKIQQQTVASPIFFWRDIDIWLYLLAEKIDFNDAYRLGYDRVGCWCCPNNNDRAHFLSTIYMPEETEKWRNFLVDFAKRIGKPDPEVYIDTGKWKARQGGNGLSAAEDVKIRFTNCTAESNAKIYQLNRPINEEFISLFNPLGRIAPELGRSIISETIIVDIRTGIPIISIQPLGETEYADSIKINVMNTVEPEDLHRRIAYQVRKYNACRKCLKCESICKYGAITISADSYYIDGDKCKRCKKCVTAKYLSGGCMMEKILKTKD